MTLLIGPANISQIANILGRASGKSNGGFMAQCPCHEDDTASLSLDNKNGKLLFKCMAGCTQETVFKALKDRGLMPEIERATKRNIKIVYDYQKDVKTVFQCVRYEPKGFSQRRPDGNGGWIYNLQGVETFLFNLEEVAGSDTVVFVEGEKDVLTLKAIGLTATCNPMGAGKWKPAYNESLRGKHVAMLSDNDDPGRAHRLTGANQLYGIAASIRFVDLPGLPLKGDVTDWLAISGNDKAKLIDLIKAAPEWSPGRIDTTAECPSTRQSHFISFKEMMVTSLKPDWIVVGVIKKKNLICLVGPSGEGKSFIIIDMGISIAAGTSWNGNRCLQGAVAYCAGEGLEGVDLRGKALTQKHNIDDDIPFFRSRHTISLSGAGLLEVIEDLKAIEASTGMPISVIIIDTLHRHYEGCENDSQDMAKFIAALDSLRGYFPGSSIIVVHHSGWMGAKESRGRGSSSWKAALDLELFCNQGQLLCTKAKDQEPFAPILFKMIPVNMGIDSEGKNIVTCTVQYGERSLAHNHQKLSGVNLIALESLLWAASKKAVEAEDGMVGALIGDWEEVFTKERLEKKPDSQPGALDKSFKRAVETLKGQSLIRVEGYLCIAPSTEHQQTIQSRMQ